MTAKLFSPKIVQVYNAISNLYVSLYPHYAVYLKQNKKITINIERVLWQLLKDLCLLINISVGRCDRNFLYQQNSHSAYKKKRKIDLAV